MWRQIPQDAVKVFSTRLFEVYTKEQEQFDGSYKTFERVRAYDTAKAICVVDDKILIERVEMPGINSFLTLPGGMLDLGEVPEDGIQREIEEETWIKFQTFEKLHQVWSNIGLVENYKYYFVARNPVHFGEQQLDTGGERISIEYITFEQMIEYIMMGEVFRDVGDWMLRKYILPWKEEALRRLLFGK